MAVPTSRKVSIAWSWADIEDNEDMADMVDRAVASPSDSMVRKLAADAMELKDDRGPRRCHAGVWLGGLAMLPPPRAWLLPEEKEA